MYHDKRISVPVLVLNISKYYGPMINLVRDKYTIFPLFIVNL